MPNSNVTSPGFFATPCLPVNVHNQEPLYGRLVKGRLVKGRLEKRRVRQRTVGQTPLVIISSFLSKTRPHKHYTASSVYKSIWWIHIYLAREQFSIFHSILHLLLPWRSVRPIVR